MKNILALLLCLFVGTVYGQKTQPIEENCIPVPGAKEYGQVITFYAYAYHTSRLKEDLRVSNVFQISYNFDPASRVDHLKIALRMSQDFNFFVQGMLMETDPRRPLGPMAKTTQNYATYMCTNADAVISHRNKMIAEFEKFEKPVHEESSYAFEYIFSKYYKANNKAITVVTVTKM